ncbi:hypothetical protein KAZ01_00455 [Candidatus Gracilibacteria bacterium]|nr:hypothetical protein [Candidatus Gracilibacteria bacterium]
MFINPDLNYSQIKSIPPECQEDIDRLNNEIKTEKRKNNQLREQNRNLQNDINLLNSQLQTLRIQYDNCIDTLLSCQKKCPDYEEFKNITDKHFSYINRFSKYYIIFNENSYNVPISFNSFLQSVFLNDSILFTEEYVKKNYIDKENFISYKDGLNERFKIFDSKYKNKQNALINVNYYGNDNFTDYYSKSNDTKYLINKDDIETKKIAPTFINLFIPYTFSNSYSDKFSWSNNLSVGLNFNVCIEPNGILHLFLDYSSMNFMELFGTNNSNTKNIGSFGLKAFIYDWIAIVGSRYWSNQKNGDTIFSFDGWKIGLDLYYKNQSIDPVSVFSNISYHLGNNNPNLKDLAPSLQISIGFRYDLNFLKNKYFW